MLSGWCLCIVKGVIVPKQVRKVQLVPHHATTALSPSAFNCYPPLFLLLELPLPVLGEGTILGQNRFFPGHSWAKWPAKSECYFKNSEKSSIRNGLLYMFWFSEKGEHFVHSLNPAFIYVLLSNEYNFHGRVNKQ